MSEDANPQLDEHLESIRPVEVIGEPGVPYVYSQETFSAPETATVTEMERTVEGYVEIEWQYRDIQHALALDFDNFAIKAMGMKPDQVKLAAQRQIDQMNESRIRIGAEPIDSSKIHGNFLIHLSEVDDITGEQAKLHDRHNRFIVRPKWEEFVPKDSSAEAIEEWEDFKSQYPETMQINLEEFRLLDGKMRVLSGDSQLQELVRGTHAEHLSVMRAASAYIGASHKINLLSHRIADLYKSAGASGRSLTPAEQRHIETLQLRQIEVRKSRGDKITSPEMVNQVRDELKKRDLIEHRREFERGLVMTKQMQDIITELMPSLAQGRPALLVGETGGAKTALAEHIAREYFGKKTEDGQDIKYEFISGYGDVNSYQMMGKTGLKNDEGTTVSDFTPGPMIRAMEAGVPIILDEVNGMPPEFLKRLNKILQLRPGDVYTVQEDSGYEVTVKPGFVVIATANEKSKRYKGIEDLSVEFQNRFGANVYRIRYPDHNVPFGEPPRENATIAAAALTDRSGSFVGGINPGELESFVRACHVTQQVFSGNYEPGYNIYVDSQHIADNKPGLEETVLAPRTMVDTLEKVRLSGGTVTLEQAISRFVSGIKNQSDRKMITQILQGHGFLKSDG